jgi:hypothetical protein
MSRRKRNQPQPKREDNDDGILVFALIPVVIIYLLWCAFFLKSPSEFWCQPFLPTCVFCVMFLVNLVLTDLCLGTPKTKRIKLLKLYICSVGSLCIAFLVFVAQRECQNSWKSASLFLIFLLNYFTFFSPQFDTENEPRPMETVYDYGGDKQTGGKEDSTDCRSND